MAGSPLKKARRLAATAKPIDPLDEPAAKLPLPPIPWNKVALTDEQAALVAKALEARRTRKEVAAALGVNAHTLRRLIRETPALSDATEATDEAELEEIRSLLMAHGRAGDTVALIFLGKAFHGLRDREDATAKKVAAASGGVLLLPAPVSLDEWEAVASTQQTQFRERPEANSFADFRSRSIGDVERTLPGDLPS